MEIVIGVIVGLVILVLLVIAHELGHAIAAIRNGVVVEEFGIGLPPRAWKKKLKNGVLLSLNWLPLGGFVKLQGEHDAADKKGDYGAATFWRKTKILLAGVAVNWLIAALLLTMLAWTGLPKILSDQFTIPGDTKIVHQPVEITSLTKDHAAQLAGIQTGDVILRFAGKEVPTIDSLIQISRQNAGKTVSVIYSREGVENKVQVTLGTDVATGIFGAGLGQRDMIKTTWSAPIVGVVTSMQFTWVTLQGIGDVVGNLFNGLISLINPSADIRAKASSDLKTVGDSVAGPIGILGTIFPAAQKAGATQLVFLTAIISLTLAVMNVLPIPALDGGRWVTTALFRLSKKNLSKELEEKIQAFGFSFLMGLILLVTIADVAKLF